MKKWIFINDLLVIYDSLILRLVFSGDKFLCGIALLATTRTVWLTTSVFYVWYRLLDGCGFCETKCGGN